MPDHEQKGYDVRAILSKMREEYWEALSDEEEAARELLECLVVRLGGERYAFETHYAREVVRMPKLIRVPAVQSLVAGIFNLRGEITAAMDVRPLLGLAQPELDRRGRILVVRSERFATGIIAEAALGVQGLSFENFEPALSGNSEGQRLFTRGHFNDPEGAIVLLDMEALLASPELLIGEQ